MIKVKDCVMKKPVLIEVDGKLGLMQVDGKLGLMQKIKQEATRGAAGKWIYNIATHLVHRLSSSNPPTL